MAHRDVRHQLQRLEDHVGGVVPVGTVHSATNNMTPVTTATVMAAENNRFINPEPVTNKNFLTNPNKPKAVWR